MANTINDPVFGKMELKHGWQKVENVQFWGKAVQVKVKATQYGNTTITEIQQKSYRTVIENLTIISEKAKNAVEKYINHNAGVIKSSLPDVVLSDAVKLVSLRSMIFFADGKYGFLFDCDWDTEHGLAVTLPDYQVGPQDILL